MFTTLLSTIVLATSAFASPYRRQSLSPNYLYFITNDPQGNYVVAANIDANGNPIYAGVASAGGAGVHGLVDPNGPVVPLNPDATFSQGVVQVHQGNGLLATVNTANHTVVLFAIDPSDPGRLTMLGQPVPSGGEAPNSLVFNKAGDQLWVLNTGAVNGIAGFTVTKDGLQPQDGTFRPLGLNETTPSTGPFGAASQVVYTQDEKNVIAAVKGPLFGPGFLAAWPIGDDGQLAENFTEIATAPGGGHPFSLTPIPGQNAFFSADFSIGVDVYDFSNGIEGVNNSPRTIGVAVPGQDATCWSAYSELLDKYYVMDVTGHQITEVQVDSNLAVTVGANWSVTTGPIDSVAMTVSNHSYLYTLLAKTLQIGVWKLDVDGLPESQQFLNLTEPVEQDGAFITMNYVQGMASYTADWEA
ncbi:unnamed protein product [Peniophora sp. CBMAI 1063]|nr:unnamed protein product [Peniophora sp. CBMAI 1063]